MRGKKAALARVLDGVGVTALALRARARLPWQYLTVLTYHRVHDVHGDERCDTDVIDATPAQFTAQLETIARHFSVISIVELLAYLEGGPIPKNPCLITFDDGYRDCVEVAMPLLQQHGLSAVFFIATDFVEHRRAYWWDRVSYLVTGAHAAKFTLEYPELLTLDFTSEGARIASRRKILRTIKDHHGLDLERYLDALSRALNVEWTPEVERKMANDLVMTWDQIRQLRAAGMDVQSHTKSHRVLHTLPPNRLADELAGSRSVLERELGESISVLAYPVGKSIAEHRHLLDAVHDAGYRIGFSNASGVAKLSVAMNPYDVNRIAMDRDFSQEQFRTTIALPWLV